jgi:hypothetical protein
MSARLLFASSCSLFLVALCFDTCPGDEPAAEAGRAAAPTLPAPRLFTLQAPKVPLSKALAELEQQTGVRVEDARGEADRDVSLDRKQVTFWQAADAVAEAAGARLYLYPRSGRITLVPRGPDYRMPPVSYDGLFRTSLKRVVAARDLERRDGAPGSRAYTVTLEVAWEPRLQPFLLETRPQSLRLQDDKRHHIPVPEEGNSFAPVDGRISLAFDVTLPALPRSAATLGLLEGKLSAVGPSKMLTFTFETLDRLHKAAPDSPERRLTQEGVVCKVSKVVLAQDRWTVQVILDYPPGGRKLESYQSWVVNNEMTLVEKKGAARRLPSSSYVQESASSRRAVLSYNFVDKGKLLRGRPEDWKVTYRTPAAVVEVPIRFSFKDVPLP